MRKIAMPAWIFDECRAVLAKSSKIPQSSAANIFSENIAICPQYLYNIEI